MGKTWGEALARALSLTMIATAAAPVFSPLAGSMLSVTLGWAGNFILVGLAAIVLAFFYVRGLGETHPADRRAPHSAKSVMQAYWRLTLDKRFILPTLSMSLLMSGLLASFAAAPLYGSVALVNGANLDPGKTFVQSLFAASDAKTYAAAPLPRRSHSPGQTGATSNAID